MPRYCLNELGVVLDGFAYGAEYYAELREFFLERGFDGNGVHNGVDGHSGKHHALFERYAELVERLGEFGVYLLFAVALCFGRGVVGDGLVVDFGHVDVPPFGLFQGLPVVQRLEPEVEQPFRFAFLCGYGAHHVVVEPLGYYFGGNVGGKTIFVLLFGYAADELVFIVSFVVFFHSRCCFFFLWLHLHAARMRCVPGAGKKYV